MRNWITIFFCLGLVSCENSQTLYSPDGKHSLTFIQKEGLYTNPQDVYIYYSQPPVNKKEYIRVRWSSMVGVSIWWDIDPIKINVGSTIFENTIPSNLVDTGHIFENEVYKESFKNYDFPDVMQGKYSSKNK